MKHHISWTGYLEAVLVLLVIYYGYIFIKFYSGNLRLKFARPGTPTTRETAIPSEIFMPDPTSEDLAISEEEYESQLDHLELQQTMNDADLLLNRAKQAIDIAAKRPYSPERTITVLKEIAAGFTSLKASPYLPGIAEVISIKCEETGTATLTEEEVSAWWDDQ